MSEFFKRPENWNQGIRCHSFYFQSPSTEATATDYSNVYRQGADLQVAFSQGGHSGHEGHGGPSGHTGPEGHSGHGASGGHTMMSMTVSRRFRARNKSLSTSVIISVGPGENNSPVRKTL